MGTRRMTIQRKSLQVKTNWIPRRRFSNSSVIILVKRQILVQLSQDIGKLIKRSKLTKKSHAKFEALMSRNSQRKTTAVPLIKPYVREILVITATLCGDRDS